MSQLPKEMRGYVLEDVLSWEYDLRFAREFLETYRSAENIVNGLHTIDINLYMGLFNSHSLYKYNSLDLLEKGMQKYGNGYSVTIECFNTLLENAKTLLSDESGMEYTKFQELSQKFKDESDIIDSSKSKKQKAHNKKRRELIEVTKRMKGIVAEEQERKRKNETLRRHHEQRGDDLTTADAAMLGGLLTALFV